MNDSVKKRLTKKDIFTIPNILSFFRIVLIPVMAVLYCVYEKYIASVCVIAVSGITDVADGHVARKFNMVSDFGKFLDPVADKLTQAAMIICLISKYKAMIILIILMAIKEILLFICGYIVLKATDNINSAKWFGKVSTATVYSVMIFLFLVPNISNYISSILIGLCAAVLLGSTLLYLRFYYILMKDNEIIKK